MNSFEGETIVIALTPKDGDIIVDVGYRTANAPRPESAQSDGPIRKTIEIPKGLLADSCILPVPDDNDLYTLKNRIHHAFAELYRMDISEVEFLFEYEELDEEIECSADVFLALNPCQAAVAFHRRIVADYSE